MIGQTSDIRLIVSYFATELWARRWIAVGIAWLCFVPGLIWVASLPDKYQSSTRIYVDTESMLNPLMSGIAVQSDPGRQLEFIRRTLLSRPNIEELIRDTNLDLSIRATDPEEILRAQEDLIKRTQREIRVAAEGAGLYRISYSSTNPERARQVTESMLSIFREQNISNTRGDLIQSRRFIDNQIVEYENRLSEAEQRVLDFRRANADALRAAENAGRRVSELEGRLRSLEVETQSGIWARDQIRLQMDQIPRYLTPETMDEGGLGPGQIAGLELGQCGQLLENRRMLLISLRPEHPTVRNLDRMIEGLGCMEGSAEEAEEGEPDLPTNPAYADLQNSLRAIEQQMSSLEFRKQIVQDELSEARAAAETTPQVALRLQQLNRDYDAIRSTYNTLIERRESARLAQSMEDESTRIEFRVVEPPILPLTPSGPNRLTLSLGVLVVSLGAGGALAFAMIYVNNSFRTILELRDAIRLPVLGSVTRLDLSAGQRAILIDVPLMLVATGGLIAAWAVFVYLFHIQMLRPDVGGLISRITGLLG